ncbi:MAG: ribonuclease E/G [Pseudomonadota bacterium]
MSKKMLIDATHAEETRVVVVDGNKVEDFDFESLNKRQLAGNIYLAKVTRVEPSLQAAFVDYGGNRHGFLAFSEIHPDYYQIPTADREALLREEAEYAKAQKAEEDEADEKPKRRRRTRSRSKAAQDGAPSTSDALQSVDLSEEDASNLVEDLPEGATIAPVADAAADDSTTDAPAPDEVPSEEAPTAEAAPEADATADAANDPSEAGEDQTDDAEDTPQSDEYDDVGANDAKEEVAPRKPRPRRYKIQEVIKVRQILLVQVVKEERGNKGAALTTYLSLAGRYCVLMPNTARGGGISRKITNASDRKKLKEIANSIEVPEGAGLIIRTAGSNRTKTEIKRDYEYLLRQWEQIRELTLQSIAPAPIYEEGSLIRRSIRDLYSRDIDDILVEGERGYREAKDYMKMLMPSHAKNVKSYTEALPLFSRFNVEKTLDGMFNPTVQLRSGGYIVIDVTEALVAVDVNSGKATKEGSIEETALKTNLEAAEEVARQAKLRDLAGLIVIDFIDMEERRNNTAVEKRLKDRLKDDRARIQVGRISGFGLLEMSRQRLRPGMLEATTTPCAHCHGTGRVRSADSMALAVMRELEEEGVRRRSKEVLVTVPVEIANYMLNQKREHVAMIETRFGLSVRIEGDPTLISPDYKVERFKTATRIVPEPEMLNTIAITSMPDLVEEDEDEDTPVVAEAETAEAPEGEDQPKRKRRRRRRRGGKGRSGEGDGQAEAQDGAEAADEHAEASEAEASPTAGDASNEDAPAATPADDAEEKPKRRRVRARKPSSQDPEAAAPANEGQQEAQHAAPADSAPADGAPANDAPPKPRRRRSAAAAPAETPAEAPAQPTPEPATPAPAVAEPEPELAQASADAPVKPAKKPRARASAQAVISDADATEQAPMADAPAEPAKTADAPKRKGWWARTIGGG